MHAFEKGVIEGRRWAEGLLVLLLALLAAPLPAAEPAAGEASKLTVSGKVLDPQGKPVANAKVMLREWSSYRRGEDPFASVEDVLATTTTNEQGEYSFQDVAPRPFQRDWPNRTPWDVVVQAEGYALAWQHLTAANPPAPVNLTLTAEAKLSGQVLDAEGKPVAGARVSAEELAPLDSPMQSETLPANRLDLGMSQAAPATQTDAQGQFELAGLPAAMRVMLIVSHDEFARQSVFVATTDQPQPNLVQEYVAEGKAQSVSYPVYAGKAEVKLQPGCRITGTISFANTGKPCAKAQVALTSPSWFPATSDGEGRFSFTGVPPATYQLMAYPPGDAPYLVRQLQVVVEPKETTKSLAIALEPGQVISGKVVAADTKAGVPNVEVYYQPKKVPEGADRSLARAGVSDAQGMFHVVAPTGEAELILAGPVPHFFVPVWRFPEAPDARFTRPIQVTAGKSVEGVVFSLTRGLIIGGVVTDTKEQPVEGAEVMVIRNEYDPTTPTLSTQTDGQGHFALTGLPPAEPQELLVVHPERKLIGSAQIAEAKSDLLTRTEAVRVQLQAAASASGQVLLGGKPLPNVLVTLLIFRQEKEQRYAMASDSTTTDAQGQYRFEMLEPGEEYGVACQEQGYSQEQTETFKPKPDEHTELTPLELLRTDRRVAGQVVDPEGKPLEGVMVNVLTRAGRRVGGASTLEPTGKDGRFAIETVPNEPLTLVGYLPPAAGAGPNARVPSARVDANPDQTDVRLVLDPKAAEAAEKK